LSGDLLFGSAGDDVVKNAAHQCTAQISIVALSEAITQLRHGDQVASWNLLNFCSKQQWGGQEHFSAPSGILHKGMLHIRSQLGGPWFAAGFHGGKNVLG
jgi:hypothetical protein